MSRSFDPDLGPNSLQKLSAEDILSSAIFFKIKVSNSLDPDQARHFVGPDLGPNCLQKLSAEDILLSKINFYKKLFQEYPQRVKQFRSRSGPTVYGA